MRLTLHHIDVFDLDRAAVAEIHHEHRKTDRRFRRRHRKHEQREYLADDVADERRKRHQVYIDSEQDQLDKSVQLIWGYVLQQSQFPYLSR